MARDESRVHRYIKGPDQKAVINTANGEQVGNAKFTKEGDKVKIEIEVEKGKFGETLAGHLKFGEK